MLQERRDRLFFFQEDNVWPVEAAPQLRKGSLGGVTAFRLLLDVGVVLQQSLLPADAPEQEATPFARKT